MSSPSSKKKSSHKAIPRFVADFETTTLPTFEKEGVTRVWAWGLANVETANTVWDVEIGTDIDEFIRRIGKQKMHIYFHNLKFDGLFILDWLLRHGFEYTDNRYQRPGEFTCLISDDGVFYTINVCWKNGITTEFRDSYKKLPMKVKVIAKSFGLAVSKGELDYDLYRPIGHRLTLQERSYVARDVLIVAQALRIQFAQGAKRLTVGSDALAEYKSVIGADRFRDWFPVLEDDIDLEIRQAYRGGFTYADKRFRGKRQGKGRVYDVNSLYPYVMYSKLLPYGEPVKFKGKPPEDELFPLYIMSITFTAKLKKKHIPCIQIKNNHSFLGTEYLEKVVDPATGGPVTLWVTNVDLALWQEHYDMTIVSYNGGYMFRGAVGFFREDIDKWSKIKAESEGGIRALAKLFLNSLYGKFASNPDVSGKYPVLDEEKDIVVLKDGPEETRDPVYTAMGVFITSYARDLTIRAAQVNYDTFAYADTDSLHLLTDVDPDNLHIHKSELGAWKFEYEFSESIYLRAKQYIEHRTDYDPTDTSEDAVPEYEVHVAGLPDESASMLNIDNLHDGLELSALKARRVPGGVILFDVGFKFEL